MKKVLLLALCLLFASGTHVELDAATSMSSAGAAEVLVGFSNAEAVGTASSSSIGPVLTAADNDISDDDRMAIESFMRTHRAARRARGKVAYDSSEISEQSEDPFPHAQEEKDPAGKKLFKCRHCNYSSIKNGYVVRHENKRHSVGAAGGLAVTGGTSNKLFKCRHCNYSSSLSGDFRKHERLHTGDKPFACRSCPYHTATRSLMVTHERIHSGDKPYKCRYCDFTASQLGNCQRHERVRHPDEIAAAASSSSIE